MAEREGRDGNWGAPAGGPRLPLSFSLLATRATAAAEYQYGARPSPSMKCLVRGHIDGDALWDHGHDRRQNVRRAGPNLYARSDVDSPTAGTLGHV